MRALGVDYGRRRIGLALSDASGTLARPWRTIERTGNPSQVAQGLAGVVATLRADDEAVAAIVLGFPRRLNGEPTEQTRLVAQVADHLRSLVAIPVVLQDERLSSREAEALLAQRQKDWRKRKDMIDAMAAAVILQDYLDEQGRRQAPTEDDDA